MYFLESAISVSCYRVYRHELTPETCKRLDALLLPPLTKLIEGYVNELIIRPGLAPPRFAFPWLPEPLRAVGDEETGSPDFL